MKRVVSFDGGGMRGLASAHVGAAIESKSGPLAERADLLAGTSTGGIIALGLAKGLPAAGLVDLYRQNGARIFSRSVEHELATLGGADGPKYTDEGIHAVLYEFFGNSMLSEAKTDVLVTSYDAATDTARFFKSWTLEDAATHMATAARATSAAPTYFDPLHLMWPTTGDPSKLFAELLIDGGVCANNPAACAWADAVKLWPGEEITVISIGTGNTSKPFDPTGWGIAQWARSLVDAFMGGASAVVDYQMRALCPRYYRVQVDVPSSCPGMDDASAGAIQFFDDLGARMIQENAAALDTIAAILAA